MTAEPIDGAGGSGNAGVGQSRIPPMRRLTSGASGRPALLVVPGMVLLIGLFIWPLGEMVVRSLTEPTLGLGNYERFFGSPATVQSLLSTFRMASVATLACVLTGYPYAYLTATSSPRWTSALLAAVIIPSFVSFLVRIFSLQILLRDTGVVNSVLREIGVIDSPLPLIRNDFAVTFGMTAMLLPLFVLPAYAVMRRIDADFMRAAAGLGASPIRSFLRIYLPLSLPGVAAGSMLVFVIALSFYITPAILGSGRSLYLSQLVVYYTGRLEWGYGSAIAVILLLASLMTLLVASRVVRLRDVFGVGVDP